MTSPVTGKPRIRKDVSRSVRLRPEIDRLFFQLIEQRGSNFNHEARLAIEAHLKAHA